MAKPKHVHEAEAGGFVFTTCKRGHAAWQQKTCRLCGRTFCQACQAGDETVDVERIEAVQSPRKAGF